LVFVGDTQARVDEMLGSPSIEFPKGDTMVRWYAGYEITTSNNIVTTVKLRELESEEERLEKAERARLAEQRMRSSYDAMANKEKVSYEQWLQHEEQRLADERARRKRVEEYEKRKDAEERTRIIADAIKDCGCRRGHYCSRCR
jgi:hypothetical protein